MLQKGDVLLGVSVGGKTEEIIRQHHAIDMMQDMRVGNVVLYEILRNGEPFKSPSRRSALPHIDQAEIGCSEGCPFNFKTALEAPSFLWIKSVGREYTISAVLFRRVK